jgi:hypothetical protein
MEDILIQPSLRSLESSSCEACDQLTTPASIARLPLLVEYVHAISWFQDSHDVLHAFLRLHSSSIGSTWPWIRP